MARSRPRPARGRSSTSSTRRTRSACPTSPKYWNDAIGTATQYEAFKLSDQLDYDEYGDDRRGVRRARDRLLRHPLRPAGRRRARVDRSTALQDRQRRHHPPPAARGGGRHRQAGPALDRRGDARRDRAGRSSGWASGRTSSCCWSARSPTRRRTRTATSRASRTFRREFAPYLIGMSDHTLGTAGAWMTAALGGVCIEKHYTIDKALPDVPDHAMSVDPAELAEMVAACDRAATLRGDACDRRARVRAAGPRQRPPLDRARARRRAGRCAHGRRPRLQAARHRDPSRRRGPRAWSACGQIAAT